MSTVIFTLTNVVVTLSIVFAYAVNSGVVFTLSAMAKGFHTVDCSFTQVTIVFTLLVVIFTVASGFHPINCSLKHCQQLKSILVGDVVKSENKHVWVTIISVTRQTQKKGICTG